MSVQNPRAAEVGPEAAGARTPDGAVPARGRRAVVNWVLALLTVPAAAVVVIFAVGAAMSVAACSAADCPAMGPSGLIYGVLLYGAPVVSALTIVISVFTAVRRRGFIVPLVALVLLLADFTAIAVLF